jgi:hypothetical protein
MSALGHNGNPGYEAARSYLNAGDRSGLTHG